MPEFLDLHGRTNKAVRALADAAAQRHGLYLGQDHLLAALWERDGQTPGELAALADVSTPAVVKMANRMSEAGLVRRVRDEKDSRLVRLWLTDKGRDLQEPVERERARLEDSLTAGLSPSDRRRLIDMLKIVHRTAQTLRTNGPGTTT